MMHAIEVDNLDLYYGGEVQALDGVSFALDGGKIYGLLGRNGAGKSSLLSILAAFRRPSGGEVRIGGQPVWENAAVMRDICLIRETADTVEHSESVVAAFDFAAHMRPRWDAEYARELIEKFEIPDRDKISELSRGKRAALWVILGLASRAPVTLFDEPYIGMDAPSRYIFYEEILSDFIEHPRTIVVSTHLIEEVASLFEEVVIIDRGTLVLHEDADTLRARGVAVTGPAEQVDQFVEGMTVLNSKQLGPTRSVMVYGNLGDDERRRARGAGLELEALPLQDLFVHLTRPAGGAG